MAILREKVRSFAPDVVGLSLRNIKVAMPGVHADDFEPQQRTVEAIRAEAPGAVLVAGGTAFSLYAEAFMRRLPELDFGLWGEGEHRFPQLLASLDNPSSVPGTWFRDPDGTPRYSGAPPSLDFSSLQPFNKTLVPFGAYKQSSTVSVGLQSKRGCALHCVHCSDTFLLGHTVRCRPAKDVVDEMEALVLEHGVERLFFCDQIFNIPVRHAIEICQEIVARGLIVQWSAWFNEKERTLPDELIDWCKRAGCVLLSFSPDHVDDRILKNLDKNFRHKDLLYTIDVAKRHDMDVEYSFFLNSPGEDLRSLLSLFRFLARARMQLGPRLRMFTLLMMQPIRIYPHSRLFELARETGMVDVDADLIEGAFWNPGSLSYAAAGVQAGAQGLYALRNSMRRLGIQPAPR
jgi:radical SAM superfamily enzyme YgiQ (UPF0313 family)